MNKLLFAIIGIVIIVGVVLIFINDRGKQPFSTPTATSLINGETSQEKSLTFVEPRAGSFTIEDLPDVRFVITRITKAVGSVILDTGCNGRPASETFREYLYFGSSGICINVSTVDGRERALVAVDVDIANDSPTQFSGDLLQLFYNLRTNGEDITRLATAYLPFRSYTIDPFSNRTIRVGFVIPDNQDEVILTYGYYGADYRSGENFLDKVEGGFLINFKSKIFSEIPG